MSGSPRRPLPVTCRAIGIPVSWFLAFKCGLGVEGLWLGVGVGALLQAVVIVALVARWDWRAEVARVQHAVAGGDGGSSDCMPAAAH